MKWRVCFLVVATGCGPTIDVGGGAPSSRGDAGGDGASADGSGTLDDATAEGSVGPGSVKRVFVTASTYKGDLRSAGHGTDGIAGADNLCVAAAARAGLGGRWKALLAGKATNAFDRVADVGPWYLVDGKTKVFVSRVAMMSDPLHPINVDETGAPHNESWDLVWTGSTAGGVAGWTCGEWTGVDPAAALDTLGEVGDARLASAWLHTSSSANCDQAYHLYCFEQ